MKATYRSHIAAGHTYEAPDPLGDQIREFEERVGLRRDATSWALEQHRKFLELQGKEWDDTPVAQNLADLNIEYDGMGNLNAKLAAPK